MREKATETRALPIGYKRMLTSMERHLKCRRCDRHIGLGWVTRGAYALHPECAELYDMRTERLDLEARVESRTPAAFARRRAAEAALAGMWR